MLWTLAFYALIAFVAIALALVWQVVHLAAVLKWSDQATLGARYYTQTPAWRRQFRRWLGVHAVLLWPILTLLGATTRPRFSQRCIRHAGVSGPAGACTAESFRQAAEYQPRSEDVFVVTQMRSGTTWMQHLVYQVLTRGSGDLIAEGNALNAVSPWIEAVRTIGVDRAPLVGRERPARIIKTHLPLELCPQAAQARYIYVARHPLDCFASCVDFVRGNLRGFAPDWPECARWYMSDELMWWGTWVTHVGHWQRHAEQASNVLFVRYEDMTADLAAVARQVATFLGLAPLSDAELAAVCQKCSRDYMRRHENTFEMHPPHLLQAASVFFTSGSPQRASRVPPNIAETLLDWARYESAALGFAVDCLYPDLAVGAPLSPVHGASSL